MDDSYFLEDIRNSDGRQKLLDGAQTLAYFGLALSWCGSVNNKDDAEEDKC